jgi:hypothetical protein
MTKKDKEELRIDQHAEPTSGAAATAPAQQSAMVTVDDSKAIVCYANFCRVTGTPEELILDFGLNSNPIGIAGRVEVAQRLVLNYYTAKRLLQALSVSVQRHESAFGALETNVEKRLSPAARRAVAQVS